MPTDQPFPSVWTRPQPPQRNRPALSRRQIVAAALELLDAEGIDALSMRKLGARLNAGATSMYTHVTNREELIELVVDEVYGEVDVPESPDPERWRDAAAQCAHSMRATILRHPWIVSVLGEAGLAHLGPNMMRMSESILALFETAGFNLDDADRAMNTLAAFVIGHSLSEAAWLRTVNRSGRDEAQWHAELWPVAERAVQPYSRMRRLYAARRNSPNSKDDFGLGLESVLNGLSALRS